MRVWLTTDTHFGHEALEVYCGRPNDVADKIFNGFRNIGKDDMLIHLGDVCIGGDEYWHDKLSKTGGKRILVKGNHDRKSNHWYLTHGWGFVCDSFDMTYKGRKIKFSHIPIAWDGYYDLNIHGHFHNSDYRRQEKELLFIKNGYQKLLALEYTNYQPVLLDGFISEVIDLSK